MSNKGLGFFTRIPPEESLSARERVAADEPATPPAGNESPRQGDDSEIERFAAELLHSVRPPLFSLDMVILPDETRRQIEICMGRIRNHQFLYDTWQLGSVDPYGRRTAVNFYGQPGTGKTMCAEALASAMGLPIIDIDYASLESKYVGETGKRIRGAFLAAKQAGALLFFDEADSILGKRMTQITQATDQAVNTTRAVMLKALDAFDGVVVFATNLARNFDGAFVRRILQHIEIPLPDAEGRRVLWQRLVPAVVTGRETLDWADLAARSDGLSGGEIKNAVVIGLTEAAGRAGAARRVQMDDLTRAVADVQRSARDIGNYRYDEAPAPVVSRRQMTLDEARRDDPDLLNNLPTETT